MTGIALVCSQCRHRDGVDQLLGIAVVEADPHGFRHGHPKREVQLSLCRIGVAEEQDVLASAKLCASVAVGDDAHALDAFGNAHLRVEDGTVCREVHASDVVGGKRGVFQLYPGLTIAELIHDAGGVVRQYLIDTDILGALAKNPRGTEKQHSAEQ